METQIMWAGNAAFIGRASSGHTVVMDGPAEGGDSFSRARVCR